MWLCSLQSCSCPRGLMRTLCVGIQTHWEACIFNLYGRKLLTLFQCTYTYIIMLNCKNQEVEIVMRNKNKNACFEAQCQVDKEESRELLVICSTCGGHDNKKFDGWRLHINM